MKHRKHFWFVTVNVATALWVSSGWGMSVQPYRGTRPPKRPEPFGYLQDTTTRGPPRDRNLSKPMDGRKDHPAFSWKMGDEESLDLSVEFPNGSEDDILLFPHNPIPDAAYSRSDESPCMYLGRLRSTASSVALTGCLHKGEESQITLLSLEHGSLQYKLLPDGKVQPISDSFLPGENRVYQKPDLDLQEYEAGWFINDADELVNVDYMKLAEKMSALCTGTGGCRIPKAHRLTLRTAYDGSLAKKEGDAVEKWIGEVMTHAQALFRHPSLPTHIAIKVLGQPKAFLDQTWTAEKSISDVKYLTFGHDNPNLYAFFCADSNYFGTVGIAYLGGICDKEGHQVSINEWRSTQAATAKVVAHEIGHNMGMSHDFATKNRGKDCSGIMDYGNSENHWSQCSARDFTANYELVVMNKGQHCMEVIADNEVPGGETEGGGGNNDGDGTSGDDGGDDGGGSEGEGKGEETGGNGKGGGGNPDYSEVCKSPAWRGDGYCDDENNNYGCGYDGGDCCENFLDHWNKYCEDCRCREPRFFSQCPAPNWVGDGFCDDENNVESCGFDLDDCCPKKNSKDDYNEFCTECKCHRDAIP